MRFPYRYELTTIINLLNTEMDQVEMLWENIKKANFVFINMSQRKFL
jgi:hypothetical protein